MSMIVYNGLEAREVAMTQTTNPTVTTPVQSLTASVLGHVAHWRRRTRASRQWLAQATGERGRLLADLGLAPGDAAILYADPVAPREQLPRMASVFSVRGLHHPLHAGVRRDLERVCALCPVKGHCRQMLASDPIPADCGFCPNSETLAALKRVA